MNVMMPENGKFSPHQPVLYHEVIRALRPRSSGFYVDATVGAGGHAAGILEHSSPEGRLLGLDVDPDALALAANNLLQYGDRVILRWSSYAFIQAQLTELGWHAVDGLLLDLGVSSMQLDTPQKGFSFRKEGALDMRFNPDNHTNAAELVNTLSHEELSDLLWRFGEERFSRKIAAAIIEARPLQTTLELAAVVSRVYGSRKQPIHPATRTFQALRIAVNRELQTLERVLPDILQIMAAGGRIAVISFHSLEDRIVKQFFQREARDCICPPRQPVCTCQHRATLRLVSKRPTLPTETEILGNPRARSARLRVAEKI